ncbi:malate transporter [Cyanobium sp. CH-040]|nr:malate transporter [Cyanobium sp. CH-040]
MLLARGHPHLAGRLAVPLLRWGVPVSITGLLLRSGLHWSYGQVLLLAAAAVLCALLLLALVPPLRAAFRTPQQRLGAVVGNTAYFGIPAALALLPAGAVGYSISYDLAATLFTWCIGPSLIRGVPLRAGVLLKSMAASPATQGLLGALLLQGTPWHQVLAAALWWPARLVIWLSLVVVGLRLGPVLGARLPLRLLPALLVKLLVFPLLLLAGVELLGLEEPARSAVVLQAAAPTAVAVLLLSEAAGSAVEGPEAATEAAALVLWSTLLALVSVPLWAWALGAGLPLGA